MNTKNDDASHHFFYIAKQIPHAMRVVKEVIVWKKQSSFYTIKVGLAANKK